MPLSLIPISAKSDDEACDVEELDFTGITIEFRNVCFSYPTSTSSSSSSSSKSSTEILKNLNLIIPAGQSVALVGQNGAGKSTIAKLLCRSFDVTSGAILLNGVDIRNINLKDLRESIAYFPQSSPMFYESVHNMIAMGRLQAKTLSRFVIEEAAKHGCAHDVIMKKMPEGYDTELYDWSVGKPYVNPSGGERQRMCASRLFLRIGQIDIPSPSSQTDQEQEQQQQQQQQQRKRTTIIISHDMATARKADRIIALDKGAIVEDGSHDELMRSTADKPIYKTFFELQASGFKSPAE
ncbi:P-loop containing nucleoside triphosphate hydrolase protein [Ramicandelaber brevisporus]|nr:P-loop containing nucleoside triphosphate hydrolase protein [Ramicandelaber brevisporus]